MSQKVQQRHGTVRSSQNARFASVVTCAFGIKPRSSFASRFLGEIHQSPVALILPQPQCPTSVDGATLFAEKHIGVLVADVYGTKEILVSASCLAPLHLLSGFVAAIRLYHQLSLSCPFSSLEGLGLALPRLPVAPPASCVVPPLGAFMDQLFSDCWRAWIKFYKSWNVNRFCSPRQFCEACDEHVRRSLEPLTAPKLDRLWKRSVLCRSLQVNLDKFHMTKSLDCHLTRSWWLTPSRKS